MVEAAGVEPASEIVASQETTCLVAFRRPKAISQSALRSRQDEQTTSPNFSPAGPDLSGRASPLCDVGSPPVDEAEDDGNLTN